MADVLHDHVHVHRRVAERLENARGHAGFVGHADERDFGLVFVERDAAHNDAFHAFGFFFHNGSGVFVQTGADFKDHSEFFGKFNRTALHHLRAEARQFEHFVVGNFRQLLRGRHDARIGGINAVHVRVNLAEVGLERRCQRDGRQIRTAAAQRRDLAFRRLALETGDDDNVALFQKLVNFLWRDVVNFGLGVDHVGDDARLRAGERHRRHVQGVQRNGRERDGLLFTGGEQHVHLAFAGQRHDFLGQLDQIIRHTAHRGNDDDDLVALHAVFRHARRNVFDAIGVADRRSAVFLND